MGPCQWSPRLKSESELLPGSANAIIKTQEFHTRDGGTHGQCGRQVNRVKRAHGFCGKRTPRPVNNIRTESPQVPVGGRGIQVRPAIGSRGFIDFSERDGANQHAIALDEREIGGHHQARRGGAPRARGGQPLPPATMPARRWTPHKYSPGATLLIEEFRGSMSLEETRELWIHRRLIWARRASAVPLLASATSPEGTPRSSRPLAWREEFCDHFAAIRHQHTLAGPHFPNVLAQTVLQFPKVRRFS